MDMVGEVCSKQFEKMRTLLNSEIQEDLKPSGSQWVFGLLELQSVYYQQVREHGWHSKSLKELKGILIGPVNGPVLSHRKSQRSRGRIK